MKALRNYLDKIKPNFEEGGKLAMFRSVFDGFETFLFVPNETSKTGVHIHDCIDSKACHDRGDHRFACRLCLFGMYNVGYQHYLADRRASQTGILDDFPFRIFGGTCLRSSFRMWSVWVSSSRSPKCRRT